MSLLKIKWFLTRQKKIKEASLNMRSAKEVLDKRDELYKLYLEADKQDKMDKTIEYRSKINALDWVVAKITAICLILLLVTPVYGAETSMTIRDKDVSGRVSNVLKVGSLYGVGASELPASIIYNNRVTTNAGTQVALAASTSIKSVSVKALSTNTGIVYVGNSVVSSADGRELQAGETVDMDINDLATCYVDVSVNGEGVTYIAIN